MVSCDKGDVIVKGTVDQIISEFALIHVRVNDFLKDELGIVKADMIMSGICNAVDERNQKSLLSLLSEKMDNKT